MTGPNLVLLAAAIYWLVRSRKRDPAVFACLVLAALAAEGRSTIRGAHHVHRGYENIERKFRDLGARIERVAEGVAASA